MKQLYEKNETVFAILWIIIYVGSMSLCSSFYESTGKGKFIALPILAAMSVFLFLWVRKNHLEIKYGLCPSKRKAADLLFYLPLICTVLLRLVYGLHVDEPAESALMFFHMMFVGFMEELIFRGFLFRMMAKDGIRSAIIVSSLTFAIGHIVNLINGSGQDLTITIVQIIFAIIFGFCMVFLFYYGGSLWPCIATHGLYNAVGQISNPSDFVNGKISVSLLLQMILLAVYAVYLLYKLKKAKQL